MTRRALSRLLGGQSARREALPPLGAPLVSELDHAVLRAGEVCFHHARTGLGDVGRAAVIARAEGSAVRQTLLNVDRWANFLPYVTQSRAIGAAGPGWNGEITLTTKGVTTELGLEWWLDEGDVCFSLIGRGGALRGGHGRWSIRAWEPEGAHTLLVLDIGLDALPWVPGFARKIAAGRGLPLTATSMAREAERVARGGV